MTPTAPAAPRGAEATDGGLSPPRLGAPPPLGGGASAARAAETAWHRALMRPIQPMTA